jgi:hypothetical protein
MEQSRGLGSLSLSGRTRQLAAVGKPYTPQDMDLYGELRSEDVNKSLIIGKYFDHHAVVDWCGASGPQLSPMKLYERRNILKLDSDYF